jgi:hypothetical protein
MKSSSTIRGTPTLADRAQGLSAPRFCQIGLVGISGLSCLFPVRSNCRPSPNWLHFWLNLEKAIQDFWADQEIPVERRGIGEIGKFWQLRAMFLV